jgi:hypothetical protein
MWIIITISVVVGTLSMLLVPWLIIQIPADYFSSPQRREHPWADRHHLVRMAAVIIKNLLGYALIAGGIAMLVLPGQGLLTLFVGLMLIDFPYKFKVERWLIERPVILKAANWIRSKAKKAPLET